MNQERLLIESKIKKIDEPSNHDIRIYDYVDAQLPVLERMFKRRAKTYKLLDYEIKDGME